MSGDDATSEQEPDDDLDDFLDPELDGEIDVRTDGGAGMNYWIFGIHGIGAVACVVLSSIAFTNGNLPAGLTFLAIAGMVLILGRAAGRLAARK